MNPFTNLIKNDHINNSSNSLINVNSSSNPSFSTDDKFGPIAIVDLDRTLCVNDRYYVPQDFSIYLHDPPHSLIYPIVQKLTIPIVVMSCRPFSGLAHSKQWLAAHNISFLLIFHRDDNDSREDWLIKEEMLLTHILPKYSVEIAFDDKPCIRSMYEKYGINCFKF